MLIPVILAGGSGTRLWPLSRELYPKQLLPLLGSNTLLQNTISRLAGIEGMGEPIVICNESHRFLVAEQLRAIDVKPRCIILEPTGKNTAPAVAVAAQYALSLDADPVLIVLPADHHIGDIESFQKAVVAAARLSRDKHLVTFGIIPDSPETGYGYIEKGDQVLLSEDSFSALNIKRFVEKPDVNTARGYLDSGNYLWNSGMFVFLASSILEELDRLTPQTVLASRKALEMGREDLDFFRLDEDAWKAMPADSIDYAVMEKTDRGVIIPVSIGWSDLGSWDSLWEIQTKDEHDNVTVGDVVSVDVARCYLHSTSRLVAAVGIEGHIVVETPDAVFICPWDRAQEVKDLVQKLKSQKREEATSHRKVFRPWGSYESITFHNRFQVKRIMVKPGAKLSLQKHHHRAEHWVVVHGTALVTIGEKEYLLREDESTYIPIGESHRLENPGKIPLELIEVQSGSYLGEDDIVRFEDIYGRHEMV